MRSEVVHDTACRRGSSAEVWKRGPSGRRAARDYRSVRIRSVPFRSDYRPGGETRRSPRARCSGSNPDLTPRALRSSRARACARVSPQCPREVRGACVCARARQTIRRGADTRNNRRSATATATRRRGSSARLSVPRVSPRGILPIVVLETIFLCSPPRETCEFSATAGVAESLAIATRRTRIVSLRRAVGVVKRIAYTLYTFFPPSRLLPVLQRLRLHLRDTIRGATS